MADYEVGFSADGTVTALKYNFFVDAGINSDDTAGSTFMGMYWADNAYYFPNYQADATICYTNTPARTSMRCPGVVQASFCTELVIERVAHELGLPTTQVQQRNFIYDGAMAICGQTITDCTLPTVWGTLLQRSQYDARLNNVGQYNARNLWRKRGISICPVKYGMGWAGYNAGCQIGINQADGTIMVSHSGSEIGQGINTKVAQGVAMALGVDLSLIRVLSSDTDKVVNLGCTGGSGTSEVTVQAAVNACQKINDRLAPYRSNGKKFGQTSTADWVALLKSLPYDVSLNAEGWYSPNENPNGQFFQYFVYAACVTELELDVLSGEVHVLASEMVYDCGQSLNPAVDLGQIEGALVMGLGYFLTERVQYDVDNGQLLTNGTWEYKPPLAQDIPAVLNVTLLKNKYNESGILGSKAVGEPPFVVANSVYFALKMAVASARQDAGVGATSFAMEVPATVDVRQQACLVHPGRFVMPY
jgi:xanthine dehydrogenase/oxidase